MEDYYKKEKDNDKSLMIKFKLFFKKIFQIKQSFSKKNPFLENNIMKWLLIVNFLINFINWLILFFFINKIDGNIILHYNVYFGVDDMGSWKKTFFMPSIGLFLIFLNAFLALFFYKNKERIASYAFLFTALVCQMSLVVASASLILINY